MNETMQQQLAHQNEHIVAKGRGHKHRFIEATTSTPGEFGTNAHTKLHPATRVHKRIDVKTPTCVTVVIVKSLASEASRDSSENK
eukprot:4004393-Amphidinium_carterae.2